jgi:hypothetical protein
MKNIESRYYCDGCGSPVASEPTESEIMNGIYCVRCAPATITESDI